jgi:tRNA pseudouridine38-40 synthase
MSICGSSNGLPFLFSFARGDGSKVLPDARETPVQEKKIRLVIAYDGSAYHGWQRQQNALTLQQVFEEKLERMLGEPIRIFASGRTDAGVHALGQVVHFMTRSRLDPSVIERGLNSLLPDDVFVREAGYPPEDFHARYSTRRKTYEYRILNTMAPDIFQRRYAWHIRKKLDNEEIRRSLSLVLGKHDFSAFRSSGSGNRNPVRTMYRAELIEGNGAQVRILLEADGFLRHMVRNLVGTLVEVGLGKMTAEGFGLVLKSGDRRMAGLRAPARGLFLVRVNY